MATIDAFCVLGPNASLYADFLYQTCSSLASGLHDIRYKALLTNDRSKPKHWTIVEKIKPTDHPSLTHGTALNKIVDHADADYVLITDVDVAVTMKGWDEYLLSPMDDTVVISGVEFDCKRSYRAFPIILFSIFDTKVLKKVNPDFRPKIVRHRRVNRRGIGCVEYKITDKQEAKYLHRRVGFKIVTDTAWNLPLFFKPLGYSAFCIHPYNRRIRLEGQKEVWGTKKGPAVCHFTKSAEYRFGSPRTTAWTNGIRNYIKQYHAIDIL